MVIKSPEDKTPPTPSMNGAQTGQTSAAANAGYGYGTLMPSMYNRCPHPPTLDPRFAPFLRRGMRGHAWRGSHMGPHGPHGHRPEVVSLEGEQERNDPSPHSHDPFWGHSHPDPPLAPVPPVAPEVPPPPPPFIPSPADIFGGLASIFTENARNPTANVGGTPGSPAPPGAQGSHPLHRGPGAWRGLRGGGPWRGRWGHPFFQHGHHHPQGPHGHFPHHGPIRPKMNIQHTGNLFIVTLELPGLQKEDVDISVADGVLTVSGEFVDSTPGDQEPFGTLPEYEPEGFEMMDESGETLFGDGEVEEGMNAMHLNENQGNRGGFILRERRFGPFKRSIKLPPWVNVDAIKATMAHGVLSLVVEKPEEREMSTPAKKITVF